MLARISGERPHRRAGLHITSELEQLAVDDLIAVAAMKYRKSEVEDAPEIKDDMFGVGRLQQLLAALYVRG